MDDLEAKVLKLVQRFAGWKRVTMASELYHDVHIYGDDVDDLIKEVHAQFSTSFLGFKANRYFPDETEALPPFLKRLGFRDKKFGSFTVDHLAKVVGEGNWFEPETALGSKPATEDPN